MQNFISQQIYLVTRGATLSSIEGAASGCKSVLARTPEGIRRSKLGIGSVPIDSKDLSFEKLIISEVDKLISKNKDISTIYLESLNTANLVKKFSYKEISKKLYKLSNNN